MRRLRNCLVRLPIAKARPILLVLYFPKPGCAFGIGIIIVL